MYYHYHKTVALVMFATCLILFMHYHKNYRLVLRDKDSRKQTTPVYHLSETENFLINTPGCFIPNYAKNLKFKEPKYNANISCGQRAISIAKLANDQLFFQIDKGKIGKYSGKKKYECCYRFASRSTTLGREDSYLDYTPCKPFKNGSKVKHDHEVITVTCAIRPPRNRSEIIYEDAYIILKKIKIAKQRPSGQSWNVLLLGMDSMSRARVYSEMPHMVQYLQHHNWLDYKGYQKVGFGSFPNIISLLMGKKINNIHKYCNTSSQECNKYLVWSMFKDVGYATAYGKDNLQLPDTFFTNQGFKSPPTDHYMRPLFLTGEKRIGHLICTKKMPSAKHMLDYAYQFIDAYKKERFFGMFWLNSYSRNLENVPSLIDKDIVKFFERLQNTGVLKNTFVMFLSDHGMEYGEMKIPISSFYEERLPMLFVWVPSDFNKIYPEEYDKLKMNQNCLITPSDVYITLSKFFNLSNNSSNVISSEECPNCVSLFEKLAPSRTCADAGVAEKWCSCHNMSIVDENDIEAKSSIQLLVSHIQNRSESIKTINCMTCDKLNLGTVLRTHSYKDGANNTYYVVALQMSPGNLSFEATIFNDGKQYTILEPTETISSYNTRGNCVINTIDRKYCVCKLNDCNKKL